MERIKFLNTEIDNVTMEEALVRIDELVRAGKPSFVVTPNMDHIILLERDKEFAKQYNTADLILADGKPLLWISRLTGHKIKEKVSGADLFPRVCEMAAKKGHTLFFLGAAPGVADKAAENLRKRLPGIKIVGTYAPPMGFEEMPEEMEKIHAMVHEAHPDLLIVCFGAPKQEKFMYRYKDSLGAPVSLGLGGTLDFESGNVKRAPKWMSRVGLEWLHRIFKDPKRMFKRYWTDFISIGPIVKQYAKGNKEANQQRGEDSK